MQGFRRLAVLAATLAALSNIAFGYYHWTFFLQRTGPFNPVRLKFDLNALPGGVVPFFIAKQGPSKMVDGDNFNALVSQIRRAGQAWNVAGPAIKTQFAGLTTTAFIDAVYDQATPAIDVVFDDELPPGVLAQTLPATYTDISYLGAANGPTFAPIVRSRVQLASDLTARNQASYADAFFTTIVHEFGHALGLQHSLTGGAMSTSVIRSTTKAQPITADDIAGLALLYPTTDFQAQTGTIAGHVTVAGQNGNLVSVVALRSDGLTVGSMTQPDGNYRIDGLPPGDYIVYAHPIPPVQTDGVDSAAIVAPMDLERNFFAPSAGFHTRFAKDAAGTTNWQEATHFAVQAGKETPSRADFALQPMTSAPLYNMRMFTYFGANRDIPVLDPSLPPDFRYWLIFQGPGVFAAPLTLTPGLQLSAIGNAPIALEQLQSWPDHDGYGLILGTSKPVDRPTPVAMSAVVGDALYVSPRAFTVVPSQYPKITSVTPGADGAGHPVALIAGENLDGTRVLFDGSEALRVIKKEDGTLEALPPPAASEYAAVVQLLGSNGQTSWQVQYQQAPLHYTYPAAGPSGYTLSDGGITAGTDQMVEIRGAGTNFVSGRTAVGFGSSDIAVRQMWVMGPELIWANVSVNPKAKLGNAPITISTGLQVVTEGIALQVRARANNQVSLMAPIVNAATGLEGVPAGGTIAMRGVGLPVINGGVIARIGGLLRDVTRGEDGVLRASVPLDVAPGPVSVEMFLPSGEVSPRVLFQVDAPAPVLQSVVKVVAPESPVVYVLDRLSLKVTGLGSGEGIDPASVEVRVAGVLQKVETIRWDTDAEAYIVEFTLSETVAAGDALPVTLRTGTRLTSALPLNVGAVRPIGQ